MSTPLLTLDNVSLSIAGSDKPILSSINFSLYSGDFLIILGSNGSGKSSLLKLIERKYQPTSGTIYFGHQRITQINEKVFYKQVKILTQNTHDTIFTSLTIYENYLLAKNRNKLGNLLFPHKYERQFLADYLYDFNPNLSTRLDQVAMQLSGGEKQALALALTVLVPPKLLLLDEHTSALDPKSAETVMEITQRVINDYHITCVLTTHDLKIAKHFGNRILSLKNGLLHHEINSHAKMNVTQSELLAACY